MAVGLTLRVCLTLSAVTVLVAAPSALALGSVAGDATARASNALGATTGELDPLVATPARLDGLTDLRAVPVLLSAALVIAAAGANGGGARQSVHSLPVRLRDVGDAWRALLLGAPPVLL